MLLKDAEGSANSVDTDQTAPLSGSALFAHALSTENLGSWNVRLWLTAGHANLHMQSKLLVLFTGWQLFRFLVKQGR